MVDDCLFIDVDGGAVARGSRHTWQISCSAISLSTGASGAEEGSLDLDGKTVERYFSVTVSAGVLLEVGALAEERGC